MTRQRSLKVRILGAAALFLAVLTGLIAFAAPALGKRAASAVPDQGNPLFLPAVPYGTGGYLAWSIAVGDVNGDGTPDLVVANQFGTVGVLLGNGDGTFQPAVGYSSGGGGALSVVIADVNGDHKPDLIVANAGGSSGRGNTVAVLLGNGDGTFQPAVAYGSGGYSTVSGELISISMVVADVNGDGKPDLVVGNDCAINDNDCTQGTVGVLLGNGDGTFRPAVAYESGGYLAGAVAVADLNGDGKPDVVVTNCATVGSGATCSGNGLVGVLLGNGDGTFQAVNKYSSGSAEWVVSPVVVADVNGDGKPDLLIANEGGGNGGAEGSAGVLLGNGDGTFRPVTTYGSGGNWAISIAVADMNADGKPDLVLANFSGSIGVLLGKGDGTFQPVQSYGEGGGDGFVALVADVNGDGIPDVVVAAVPGWVDVLLGNGDGTLQAAQSYYSGGIVPAALAVADVNGDGKPDLLVTNWCGYGEGCVFGQNETGAVGVLLNNTPFCTTPPVITVSTTPTALWPPNGNLIPVTVSGTITDTGCTVTSAAYAVTDEYGQVQPSGAVTLGAGGAYSFTVLLQASRLGNDLDGRHYTITVSASNNAGNAGSKTTVVTVPHDQRR